MYEPHHTLVRVMKSMYSWSLDSLSYEKREGTNEIKRAWRSFAVGDYKGSHTT